MKIRLKRGYEAVNTKNYKRFGTQYINFYLTDGILRKNKCARKFVPEDPLLPLIGYEETGKRWSSAIGVIELGDANYDIYSITDISEIDFLRNEEILPFKVLKSADDRMQFVVNLGGVEPYEDIILFPRISEENAESDLDEAGFGLFYFSLFSGLSSLSEMSWATEGDVRISWLSEHGGSIHLKSNGPALFKLFKILEVSNPIIVDATIKLYALVNGEADLRFGLWKEGSWLKYSKFTSTERKETISVNNLVSNSFYVLLSGELEEDTSVEIDIIELRITKRGSPIIYFMPENMLD